MRARAALVLIAVAALVGVAAGCGSDDSGDTDAITVPTTPAAITTATTPVTTPPVTTTTDTTPNVVTTPPQTTQTQTQQGNSNGGSGAQQNYDQYCKQYPGACGD